MKGAIGAADFCLLLGAAFLTGCAGGVPPRDASWGGFAAKLLESERMQVVILPGQGGAIVSILDKKAGREWLWQSVELRLKVIAENPKTYLMTGGWEDMFPSVGPCEFEDAEWGKVSVPDHGELWNRPWKAKDLPDGVQLSVNGEIFPYTLERTCRLSGRTLRLDYALTNTGSKAFPFMFAGHPVLSVQGKAQILISNGARTVVYESQDGRLGKPGARFPWPDCVVKGEQIDASLVDAETRGKTDKLFVSDFEDAEVGLRDIDSGGRLMIRFNAQELSSIGVWTNMNAYPPESPVSVAAIEPTTSPTENLAEAIAKKTEVRIEPGRTLRWSISVCVE
ncbi:MAG TPA: hypothetical protein PL033_06055 [Candidatus Brocadiia bacterium]|nr:hypothetical protein [Candidatus Brocadiia bacterium]